MTFQSVGASGRATFLACCRQGVFFIPLILILPRTHGLFGVDDFERMFAEVKPFAFLAEHVWEHMTFDDGCIAAQNCYDFLADGGYIRVAVPDANFRNEWYQGIVKVGGNGDPNHPAYTHKIVYDYKTLCASSSSL